MKVNIYLIKYSFGINIVHHVTLRIYKKKTKVKFFLLIFPVHDDGLVSYMCFLRAVPTIFTTIYHGLSYGQDVATT